MKKKLMALTAVIMAMTMVTACGKKDNNEETTTGTTADSSAETTAETVADSKDDDLSYIMDNGSLKIGYTLFAPMDYEENGELTGFEVEFGKAVCEKIGVTPEFVLIDWDTKELELKSKNIDCIWNGLTVTDDRKENMGLTVSYMNNKQVLVSKAENADKYTDAASMKGVKVVAEAGSAGEETVQGEAFFADAAYTPVDSQATALMEVGAGTADCAVIDYVMSIGSIGEGTDYSDITVVSGAEFAPEEYAIAFRKDATSTVEAVNNAIEELAKEGKLAEIAEKYKLTDLLLVK